MTQIAAIELKEIKGQLSGLRAGAATVVEQINTLTARRSTFTEKLSNLDKEISVAEKQAAGAVSQYARGEINEGKYNGMQATLAMLEEKKKTTEAVLVVLDSDMEGLRATQNTKATEMRVLEERAWLVISNLELTKISEGIRRAALAYSSSGMRPNTNAGFHSVIQPSPMSAFVGTVLIDRLNRIGVNLGVEELAKAKAELTKEYLS